MFAFSKVNTIVRNVFWFTANILLRNYRFLCWPSFSFCAFLLTLLLISVSDLYVLHSPSVVFLYVLLASEK